jgi:hypothetical protein
MLSWQTNKFIKNDRLYDNNCISTDPFFTPKKN